MNNMTQSDYGTDPRRTRILNGMRTVILGTLAFVMGSTLAAAAAPTSSEPRAVRWMPGLHQVEKPHVRQRVAAVTYAERLTGTRFYYELSNGAAWIADRPKACGRAYRPLRCWEAADLAGLDVKNPTTPVPADEL